MEKNYTSLFAIFLVLSLGFLSVINFLKDSVCTPSSSHFVVPGISLVLIIFIILLFIYREIENSKAQSQFITIITHKIKAPLTGIRWTIDMLQKDLTLLEKKDLLVEMQKANQRLMEIMDLLVHFAKFDKKLDYDLEAISLRELIDSSLSKNSGNIKIKDINFTIEDGVNLPKVLMDKPKMQFAVDMLIDNAIKYTPNGGDIKTSFKHDSRSVTLKIADNGIGMSRSDARSIFKHFFRAENAKLVDSDGLGLGLFTAKKIVEHHKGQLWAESKGVNKGSTFYIQLPIKK